MHPIHKKVKALCEAKGLLEKDFLVKADILSGSYYSMVKNDTFQIKTIEKIAKFFKVPVVSMFDFYPIDFTSNKVGEPSPTYGNNVEQKLNMVLKNQDIMLKATIYLLNLNN